MAKQKRSFGQKRENSKKEIFVGRKDQIQKFQQNIKLDLYNGEFLNIFNVFGQGGVGKTTLLNKYLSICNLEGYCIAFVDTEDTNIYEVTETMNFIANALEQQGLSFKRFTKRYREYLQERGKLEAAPNKPKGTWGKIVKTGIKVGSKIGSVTIPGGGLIFDSSIADSASEIASEWVDFVVSNITNKDEVELVLSPLKVLTPLWIEDLYAAAEKKNLALFFDTLEESNPELEKWLFKFLNEYYGEIPSMLLVVGGRSALDPEKWNEFASLTCKVKLEPFTDSEARNYLELRGISNPILIEQLLAISGCLPVYLSLLADGNPSDPNEVSDPSEKIVERFLRHIDNPVHRDLALHACLPSQFNQDVVDCLLPEQEKVNAKLHFEWLKARPFVEKRNNYWAYHSVVREIMQRHLKEVSEKEWEKYHLLLADWYESKSAKLEVNGNRYTWFYDESWRINLFEKHFHLLCSNYKKYLPGAIQDFASLLFAHHHTSTIPLVIILNNVEKILEVKSGLGEILLKGVSELIAGGGESILKMLSTINQLDFVEQVHEKSYMFLAQGIFEPNPDLAIICCQKALDINPNYPQAFYNMGLAYAHKGNPDQAIACYQKALDIKPDYPESLYNMGITYSFKGDYEQAIAFYWKAVGIKSDYFEAFYSMGIAYYIQRDYAKVIECFEMVVKIKPDNPEVFTVLGLSYANNKDYDQAIACFKQVIEVKSDDSGAFYNIGIAYSNKGDHDQAIVYYQKALDVKPDYEEAIYGMALAYYDKEDYDRAIPYYQEAFEINPNSQEVIYSMGLAYFKKGDYDQAIACYQKAVKVNPDDFEVFQSMCIAYFKKGDYEEAIACCQKALDIKPDYGEAFYMLGNIYHFKGNQEQTMEYYQKAVELKPDYPETPYVMGVINQMKGDYDQAIACYQKALEVNPDDPKVLYFIGSAHSKRGEYELAIAYYKQALEFIPTDQQVLNSIGWTYLLLGEFEIAKSYLQKVWELSGSVDFHASMNLGHVCLLHERDREAAIRWYKKSTTLLEDSKDFFEGMESDFLDLKMEKRGVLREDFQQIMNELNA